MEKVVINTEFIKLDSFIKYAALSSTGGEAKQMIAEGLIFVNGEVCMMRGKKLYSGDAVKYGNKEFEVSCG